MLLNESDFVMRLLELASESNNFVTTIPDKMSSLILSISMIAHTGKFTSFAFQFAT